MVIYFLIVYFLINVIILVGMDSHNVIGDMAMILFGLPICFIVLLVGTISAVVMYVKEQNDERKI